jgi:hypothetical protein
MIRFLQLISNWLFQVERAKYVPAVVAAEIGKRSASKGDA